MENKQAVANAILKALQATDLFGNPLNNRLEELTYIKTELGDEFLRPIFANGAGKDGWYDINISCDSGAAMFIDVAKQFVRKF